MKLSPRQMVNQKQMQKIAVYISKSSKSDPVDDFTNHSTAVTTPDSLPEDEEDRSETQVKRNERLEDFSDHVDPEVGLISRRKPAYAIVTVEDSLGWRRYEVLSFLAFENNTLEKQIRNLVRSFPHFERITVEKLRYLCTDERSGNVGFTLPKTIMDYSFFLPDGQLIPIAILKRPKGRHEPRGLTLYREFRLFLFEQNQYGAVDRIERKLFENCDGLDEFVEKFLQTLSVSRSSANSILEAFHESNMVHNAFREYFEFFRGE
ncbi:hypothetical protein [Pseudothermotoga sp.]